MSGDAPVHAAHNPARGLFLRLFRSPRAGFAWVILLGLLAHAPGLLDPATYHDEAITLQLTAGRPQPSWPENPAKAGDLRRLAFEGDTSPAALVRDLQELDVHPPVYFLAAWAWRGVFGPSLVTLRVLSVLAMVAAAAAFLEALRRAGHPAPVWTSLFLVCLSGPAAVGQAARPYGLALLFLCLASLGLASLGLLSSGAGRARAEGRSRFYHLGFALLFISCCSLAFLTSYLALYPVGVLLLAFVIGTWRRSRKLAVLVPVATLLTWVPWLGFVTRQSGARPAQDAGFAGWYAQIAETWQAHGSLLWVAVHPLHPFVVSALAGVLLVAWLRLRRAEDRPLSRLLLGWALAPTFGVLLMNLAFDKHLAEPRYFVFAAPGIVGILGYAAARIPKAWIAGLLLIGLQLAGLVQLSVAGTAPSNLADKLSRESTDTTLVAVGTIEGFDGYAGQMVNELADYVDVFILDEESDADRLAERLGPYRELWLLAPPPHATRHLEDLAFRRILESRSFRVAQISAVACHLIRNPSETRREPAAPPAGLKE